MGKSYRPYYPDEDLLLPPSLRDWLPEKHLAYFVGDGRGVWEREARPAALRSADDDQSAGIRLLRGSVQFTTDRAPAGGRHRVPGPGGGQSTELPHHLRFPKDSPEDLGGSVRTGFEDCSGSGSHEGGPCGGGWDESQSQRQQAQSDEL